MSEDYFNDGQPAAEKESDFFSGGSPSCRFNTIGTVHVGTIIDFEVAQQREIGTGTPKFWQDGNKCEMLIITLQTDERDSEIDDDDGQRRLYVNKPSGMFAAIKAAMGKNKLVVGAKLAIKYEKDGQPPKPGFNKPKEYVAKYIPPGATPQTSQRITSPTQSAGNNGIGDTTAALSKEQALTAFRAAHEGESQKEKNIAWNKLCQETIPNKMPADFSAGDWQSVRLAATPVESPFGDANEDLAAVSDELRI